MTTLHDCNSYRWFDKYGIRTCRAPGLYTVHARTQRIINTYVRVLSTTHSIYTFRPPPAGTYTCANRSARTVTGGRIVAAIARCQTRTYAQLAYPSRGAYAVINICARPRWRLIDPPEAARVCLMPQTRLIWYAPMTSQRRDRCGQRVCARAGLEKVCFVVQIDFDVPVEVAGVLVTPGVHAGPPLVKPA